MNKKLLINIIALILVTGLLTGCGSKTTIDVASVIGTSQMQTEEYRASFVIDCDDLNVVTSYASYIFIGKVTEYMHTEYLDDDDESVPITYYSVEVIENIKGELVQNEAVVLRKQGGLKRNTNVFYLQEGDILPAVGETYLFAAAVWKEDLYCFGPNMVANIDITEDYKESAVYKAYLEAIDNIVEDIWTPGETVSRYDVNYK